jgi:ornithine lipid ester-linked acyl 2-hydroxylase
VLCGATDTGEREEVRSWRECEPLLFDDTYAHSVDNDTDELRAILIVDFEPRMSLLLDAFMKVRYILVRRSEEIRMICDRATVSP